MEIPEELKQLLDKHSGKMETKMVQAYLRERSVEAIVEVARAMLREGDIHDAP